MLIFLYSLCWYHLLLEVASAMFFVDNNCPARYIRAFLYKKKTSGNNSVVECNLAKVEVASSNLVSRSTY